MILFTGGSGCLVWGCLVWGVPSLGDAWSRGFGPRRVVISQHALRQTPPGAVHAGRYGQQAGGTHPTGMHSCLLSFDNLFYISNEKFQNNKSIKKDIKCFYLNETKAVSSHTVNVSQYNSYCDILANKVLVLEGIAYCQVPIA